jgi:hypothetical protein
LSPRPSQELGFTGDIGYNQLLYPNEKDTRRLLQFLVQRLPKVEEEKVEVRDCVLRGGWKGGREWCALQREGRGFFSSSSLSWVFPANPCGVAGAPLCGATVDAAAWCRPASFSPPWCVWGGY